MMMRNGQAWKTADMKIQYSSAMFHTVDGQEGAEQFSTGLQGLGKMGEQTWEVVTITKVGRGLCTQTRIHEGVEVQTEEDGTYWNVLMKRYIMPVVPAIQPVNNILSPMRP